MEGNFGLGLLKIDKVLGPLDFFPGLDFLNLAEDRAPLAFIEEMAKAREISHLPALYRSGLGVHNANQMRW